MIHKNRKIRIFTIALGIFCTKIISNPHDRLEHTHKNSLTDKTLVPAAVYQSLVENFVVITADIVLLNHDLTKTFVFVRKSDPLKGKYWGPGGRMLKHETLLMTAKRIIQDEIGIEGIEPEYIMPMSSNFQTCDGTTKSSEINFFYAIVPDDIEFQFKITDGQHEKGLWVCVDDEGLHPTYKEAVRRAKIIHSSACKQPAFFTVCEGDWFADSRYFDKAVKNQIDGHLVGTFVLPPQEE